jgi:hypothetical protein
MRTPKVAKVPIYTVKSSSAAPYETPWQETKFVITGTETKNHISLEFTPKTKVMIQFASCAFLVPPGQFSNAFLVCNGQAASFSFLPPLRGSLNGVPVDQYTVCQPLLMFWEFGEFVLNVNRNTVEGTDAKLWTASVTLTGYRA